VISLFKQLKFSLHYLFTPPWDTGIPAPELVRTIARLPPGRAIDIGCGTGTNLLYLAQQGWSVTGIDFSPVAIAKARRKLRMYSPVLLIADATRLGSLNLPGPYDLALDMGCFHNLTDAGRDGYAAGLAGWMTSGGIFLLYAFQPGSAENRRGIPKEKAIPFFEKDFRLSKYEQGTGRPSAWYYFIRK